MDPLVILFLILVGSGASFVQRVSGFGLGIFAMMFLPHFLPSQATAVAVSCLFSCVTSTYNAVRYRKSIRFKVSFPMLIASLLTIPLAVLLSTKISGYIFEILLGVALILLSIYFLFFSGRIHIKATPVGGAVSGVLSGTLSGLFSTGGPPVVLYLSSALPTSDTYFATIQFFFCVTNIYSTGIRAASGLVTWECLLFAAFGLIGCLIGDIVGRLVFNKLNFERIKLIIYLGMIASGVLMLF